MSVIWKYQARRLKKIIDANNETYAHLYMEQLMLFPVDIQDKIIEDISYLPHCSSDAIAHILGHYSMFDLR
ncbi:MAG: hypothetical protein V5789_01125 [Colwellia sp.]